MKIFLIFILLTIPCHSRLWETYFECIDRYGKEKKVTKEIVIFEKNEIEISTQFELTKCVFISFRKINNKPFTNEEIEKLLEANRGRSKWMASQQNRPGFTDWATEDGKSSAVYDSTRKTIYFISKDWLAEQKRLDKEIQEKILDGF